MTPAATLGAYTAALAVVFTAAVGVGTAVGPVGTAAARPASHSTAADDDTGHDDTGHDDTGHSDAADRAAATSTATGTAPAELVPGGLAVTTDGHTLELATDVLAPGTPSALRFTVTGPDGEPVTRVTPTHGQDLHLVVVRRDLTGYQHLHPTRDARGTWTVPLTLAEPGPYTVYADLRPAGRDESLVLAADLTAPGAYTPVPLPAPVAAVTVDGYEVRLDGGLVAGTSSPLVLTVRRDGEPVTDLEPYLGAHGHLVALRAGDGAYLHVHPDGPAAAGPDLAFAAEVPSAATYRLFLEFSHRGVVRTAELTATATRSGDAGRPHGH